MNGIKEVSKQEESNKIKNKFRSSGDPVSVSDLTMECPYFYTKKNVRRNGPWIGFKEFFFFQMCSVVILFLRHSFILGKCMRMTDSIGDRSTIQWDKWEVMVVGRKSVEKWERNSGLLLLFESIYIYLVQGARQKVPSAIGKCPWPTDNTTSSASFHGHPTSSNPSLKNLLFYPNDHIKNISAYMPKE